MNHCDRLGGALSALLFSFVFDSLFLRVSNSLFYSTIEIILIVLSHSCSTVIQCYSA
jgi:hypothetical protein